MNKHFSKINLGLPGLSAVGSRSLSVAVSVLAATGVALASSAFSIASAANLTFDVASFTGSTAKGKVTLTDVSSGVEFKVDFVPTSTGQLADIRGVFFNILNFGLNKADNSFLNGLSILGQDVTTVVKNAGNVTSAGSGNNINPGGPFDVGVEIGQPGIGKNKGDIQSTTFTVSHSSSTLKVNQFASQNFGLRYTSVGVVGNREDSSKLAGKSPNLPKPDQQPREVPEAGTTAALALIVVGAVGFRKQKTLSQV